MNGYRYYNKMCGVFLATWMSIIILCLYIFKIIMESYLDLFIICSPIIVLLSYPIAELIKYLKILNITLIISTIASLILGVEYVYQSSYMNDFCLFCIILLPIAMPGVTLIIYYSEIKGSRTVNGIII